MTREEVAKELRAMPKAYRMGHRDSRLLQRLADLIEGPVEFIDDGQFLIKQQVKGKHDK